MRRFPALWAWPCSTTWSTISSWSGFAIRVPAFAGCSRAPWPTAIWCERCAGHGYLLGIDYVDPSDGASFLDPALGVARKIDVEALARGLVVYSTQPTADGYAGDQTLIAPAFTSTEEELSLVVERMAETVRAVEQRVKSESVVPA